MTAKNNVTLTVVEYFLLIRASKSKHCCKDCNSTVTVNEGPDFPRSEDKSSLNANKHPSLISCSSREPTG